jgi:mevalonate kinase
MLTASAPGKVILCGEHAVVYGQPAIALPLADIRATASIEQLPQGSGLVISAPDIGERWKLASQPNHPLALLARLTIERIGGVIMPNAQVTLRSAIPIASGLGSGAALGAALVRALSQYLGALLNAADISQLVYESERVFHGTPSGIDNTVVSYEQAIWFVRGQTTDNGVSQPKIEPLVIGRPFDLVIGDTGVRAPTHVPVGRVREQRTRQPQLYDSYFDQMGEIARGVRQTLAEGAIEQLGDLLNRNQSLLQKLGVSSPQLERLIDAARRSGGWGAKLSGGGDGGIMLAVVDNLQRTSVTQALLAAGATRVWTTTVS